MTYLICLRLTYLKGFFWGDKFIHYGRRWGCKGGRHGWGKFQQTYGRKLTDGKYSFSRTQKYPFPFGLMQNFGLSLLAYNLAILPKSRPWSWCVIRHLQVRSYKSSRYKLGLPANGQRTHTNANTTGRVSDEAARFIRKKRLVIRIWESRKPAKFVSKSSRPKSGKGTKGKIISKSGKTIRSKKKVDVWK